MIDVRTKRGLIIVVVILLIFAVFGAEIASGIKEGFADALRVKP